MCFFLSSRRCPSQFCLSRSLFIRPEDSRAPATFSLLYLYSVVERRMKEEYARKIHKTHESVGRRAFVCVFLFFEISFSSRSTFYICSVLFLPCLFVCGGATQKPEFQPRLEKRETSSPSQKGQKKTQHHRRFFIKKNNFGK